MIYEEPIDYLTYLLSTSQINLYETVLNTKEGANQSTFANLFSQAQKESPISNPDSFLHKLLIINLKDFDENRWSPTMYTSFIFKSLMLITTLSLVSQLDSVNESPGGSGLASLSRNLKSFQKSKKQTIQENENTPSLDTSIRQNDQQLDEILKELSSIKNLLSKVPDEVANSVVGVPYSRFDSTTTCLPCLIFHFLEVTDNSRKRSSQIKVRVNLENIVNDNSALASQIGIYVNRINERSNYLRYQYGNNRLYFVSDNKVWKTVIYTDSQVDGKQLIEQIAFISGYSISESQMSFTTTSSRKPIYTRQHSWRGINTNDINYKQSFGMKINKVVCYIKNLDQLIPVWKEQD